MCPMAAPAAFGGASWENAGTATRTTKASVSRSCFFMGVLYQRALKNAIRKDRRGIESRALARVLLGSFLQGPPAIKSCRIYGGGSWFHQFLLKMCGPL